MVYLCNSIAAANPLVTAEIVDSAVFPELVAQFKVGVVPKVLINDAVEILDVVPAAELIAKIVAAGPRMRDTIVQ